MTGISATAELLRALAGRGPMPDLSDGACVRAEDPSWWDDEPLPTGLSQRERQDARGQRALAENVAKRYCATCPVRERCLEWALNAREPLGIWGGLTEAERRELLERRRRRVS